MRPSMLCDVCHRPLLNNNAVLVKRCGHRVHAIGCADAACKACSTEAHTLTQCMHFALVMVGLLCGVFFTVVANDCLRTANEVELAMVEVQRGLTRMGQLALDSPELRPGIKRSLDRIGALILKETGGVERAFNKPR
jgi:hypothetical protein